MTRTFLAVCLPFPRRPQQLRSVNNAAEDTCGKIGMSGRYHSLPKRFEDDYAMLSTVLGSGLAGEVKLARNKHTGRECAVKNLQLPQQTVAKPDIERIKANFASEVSIALKNDHPHVARVEDVYESARRIHLVMERLRGGNVCDLIKHAGCLQESVAARLSIQMLFALNYLHKQGIVHRDLKLSNFMFQGPGLGEGLLQMIDFGMSKKTTPGMTMRRNCGTPGYKAPEVLDGRYSLECDMWSLGVVVFRMLMRHMPFNARGSKEEIAERTRRVDIRIAKPEVWESLSSVAKDFLGRLLVADPSKRLTAEQALAHPWIAAQADPVVGRTLTIDGTLVDALCRHARASRFRRACSLVASWSLTDEERAQAVALLRHLDSDNAGKAKVSDVLKACEAAHALSPDEAADIAKVLDATGSGEVGYTSLLAATLAGRTTMGSRTTAETFRRLDAGGDGYVTVDDLEAVFGLVFEGSPVEDLFSEIDAKSQGRVDYRDFCAYFGGASL